MMQLLTWLIALAGPVHQPAIPVSPDSAPRLTAGTVAAPVGSPILRAAFPPFELALPALDSRRAQRPKAIEYSEGYYQRLAIHRYASYATLPLFAAEYALGQSLATPTASGEVSQSARTWHGVVSNAIAVLFVVNTYTGAVNLAESSKNPKGITRRYVHAALMVLSDVGFVATAQLAPPGPASGRVAEHRTVAIASMSTAAVGYLLMLLWHH